MSAQPLVSVILPTHNRAKLLARAIRSVLGQSYRNLELLIVDDASTDDTPAVVASFTDPRVRYFRQPENRRAAAARNLAIRESRGELLAFQDDDDEWLPQKLERQVAALLVAPPDVGLNLCGFRRIDQDGESYIGGERYLRQLDFDDYFSFNDFSLISTPNWLLRRSVLERVGVFDERYKSLDDWELALRLLGATRFEHLDEALWIQHRNRPKGAGMVLNERLMVNDYVLLVDAYGSRWRPRVVARYCFHVSKWLVSLGRREEAWPWLRRSLRLDPWFPKAWGLLLAWAAGPRAINGLISAWRRVWSLHRLLGLSRLFEYLADRRRKRHASDATGRNAGLGHDS